MRVVPWLSLIFLLPSSLAGKATEDVVLRSLSSLTTSLEDRMNRPRAVALDICANIRVAIPGATVPNVGTRLSGITLASACLCLDNGLLTGSSNIILSGLVTPAVTTLLSALDVSLSALAIAQLGTKTTTCEYPPNAVPNSCTSCEFGCDDGFKRCNNKCTPNTTGCPTGGGGPPPKTGRKRDAEKNREDLRCPRGFDACRVPHQDGSLRLNRKAFDCVNPRTDLESCGGCMFPGPGQNFGMDCTELPASAAVSCVDAKCVIDSCVRGFVLSDGECLPQVTGRRAVTARTVWSVKI